MKRGLNAVQKREAEVVRNVLAFAKEGSGSYTVTELARVLQLTPGAVRRRLDWLGSDVAESKPFKTGRAGRPVRFYSLRGQ